MKNKIIFWGIAALCVAGLIAISHYKNKQMDNYAKTHSCTWRATGTMYGDDRDFVCMPNQEIQK